MLEEIIIESTPLPYQQAARYMIGDSMSTQVRDIGTAGARL